SGGNQAMAHGCQRAQNQHPDQKRKQRLEEAHAQPDQNVHARRNKIEHAVIATELAPAEPDLPVNPVRINDVLSECRSDTNGQDPWKGATGCTGKYAADDEKKIARVIKGSAQR